MLCALISVDDLRSAYFNYSAYFFTSIVLSAVFQHNERKWKHSYISTSLGTGNDEKMLIKRILLFIFCISKHKIVYFLGTQNDYEKAFRILQTEYWLLIKPIATKPVGARLWNLPVSKRASVEVPKMAHILGKLINHFDWFHKKLISSCVSKWRKVPLDYKLKDSFPIEPLCYSSVLIYWKILERYGCKYWHLICIPWRYLKILLWWVDTRGDNID